MHQKVP
jgi:hypothetical protein